MQWLLFRLTSSKQVLLHPIYQSTIGGTLGLADRACIALGLTRGLPVLTSDREWLRFKIGVKSVVSGTSKEKIK